MQKQLNLAFFYFFFCYAHIGEMIQNRGWGVEINPDLYKKQKDLWEQVSRRSSLSALSLATSVTKPITKAEKDAANNKKSSPTKAAVHKNTSQINFIDNKLIHDGALPGRVLHIRHHLGRTTGLGKPLNISPLDNLCCNSDRHFYRNKTRLICMTYRYGRRCFIAIANT